MGDYSYQEVIRRKEQADSDNWKQKYNDQVKEVE